jgi:cell division inhibitor SepF
MASFWQKTLFYLGLVDDEGKDAASGEPAPTAAPQSQVRTVEAPRQTRTLERPAAPRAPGGVAGRRVEPPTRQRRRISSDPEHAEAGVLVRPAGSPLPATGGDVEIIVARTFSDAQLLADHIKDLRPVVLDLRNAEAAMVRRLVDFASGLTYGLGGKMVKTAQGVILVTPAGIAIGMEERRRLAALDLYAAPNEA